MYRDRRTVAFVLLPSSSEGALAISPSDSSELSDGIRRCTPAEGRGDSASSAATARVGIVDIVDLGLGVCVMRAIALAALSDALSHGMARCMMLILARRFYQALLSLPTTRPVDSPSVMSCILAPCMRVSMCRHFHLSIPQPVIVVGSLHAICLVHLREPVTRPLLAIRLGLQLAAPALTLPLACSLVQAFRLISARNFPALSNHRSAHVLDRPVCLSMSSATHLFMFRSLRARCASSWFCLVRARSSLEAIL